MALFTSSTMQFTSTTARVARLCPTAFVRLLGGAPSRTSRLSFSITFHPASPSAHSFSSFSPAYLSNTVLPCSSVLGLRGHTSPCGVFSPTRTFAVGPRSLESPLLRKKKAKGGGKGKGHKAAAAEAVQFSESLQGSFDKEQQQMEDAVSWFEDQITSIQTMTASPSMLDGIMVVDPEGDTHPLQSICQVTIGDPRTLLIILPDPKMAKSVEKAIIDSDLDVHPQVADGGMMKIPIPKMNREYREGLIKQLGKHAEGAKDRVRRARKSGMDLVKKEKKSGSSDDANLLEKAIQKYHDDAIAKIAARQEKKTKELEGQ